MTRDELRKWRDGNGYSQAKLAKALGVASMTVTRWEMGIRSIPPFLHLALKALEGGGEKPGTGQAQKGKKTRKEV
jgi:transcriptional regulator with XRE-family HTH domain